MINASANFHVDQAVVLDRAVRDSSFIVGIRRGDDMSAGYTSPLVYVYLPDEFGPAVQAGIDAFNAAFQAAMEIREAAE